MSPLQQQAPAHTDSAERVHCAFVESMRGYEPGRPAARESPLGRDEALGVLASQVDSRLLDIVSRRLQAQGRSFYTIGSSGHEANALVALHTSPADTAFLHYRSGPLFLQRARQASDDYDGVVRDVLRSFAAKATEPISGGRHKVWGSLPLGVPPQTSTIASHLPKAVGYAYALATAAADATDTGADIGDGMHTDAGRITVASFGDASANHSSALSAFNTAAWLRHQGMPLPLLLVCEDNGIGISVPTPEGWLQQRWGSQPHLHYVTADGNDPAAAATTVAAAIERCRTRREPVFLHLRTRRLFGHAGSDVEASYRSTDEIAAIEADDPLLAYARHAVDAGYLDGAAIADRYEQRERELTAMADELVGEPTLADRAAVRASVRPWRPDAYERERDELVRRTRDDAAHQASSTRAPRHLGTMVNLALDELMRAYPQMSIFGEDVARKGGVYGVTKRLHRAFGARRVFDTLLDEQAILGLAQGLGLAGALPCPEIQYLAYLHNALDQLRGEASTTRFFSSGQFRNPMLVRVQGYGYQKGFGGHFHNDNSIAALRDIPGLTVVTPGRGDTAVRLLRTCAAMCVSQGEVVVCIEPIALYPERDLYERGDDRWTSDYPDPGDMLVPGEGQVHGSWEEGRGGASDGGDTAQLTVVTYGNGVRMSLRALRAAGVRGRVVDLCWLQPLPFEWLLGVLQPGAPVLVVDECRRTGSVSEELLARLAEEGVSRVARVTSDDCYIPLGDAANLVLLSQDEVADAARRLVGGG